MSSSTGALADLAHLEPFQDEVLQAVIETPRGSRNKYSYDADRHCMQLKKVLPAGMVFPYDFGFVPRTTGGDGDEIDVLVLMDEPAFPGCVLSIRLIGVLLGEDYLPHGTVRRNDRLLGVSIVGTLYADIRDVSDLPGPLLQHLRQFFETYPQVLGDKEYRVLSIEGPAPAMELLRAAQATHDADESRKTS